VDYGEHVNVTYGSTKSTSIFDQHPKMEKIPTDEASVFGGVLHRLYSLKMKMAIDD
jgi:hypothetical protein